ncbi:thrombospondin type 3 repeat-containing protein, partial [Candidatus Woesearchaeota archaeon]|nr:thrombospondin type 3 repeat-containing protein [Candidatus Woesearchaeota archaeon]
DGLANIDEFLKGSDPKVKDSDRDGVNDDKDKCPRTPTGTIIDADGCGLADKDKDGISDDWEAQFGLDPTEPSDALKDIDDDGLPAIDEFNKGTNPNKKDSDKDGTDDATDKCPNTPTNAKTGKDGCQTKDTDNDGMPDEWEINFGLNPNNPNDATTDTDGDGLANIIEYKKGTNPSKPDTDKDGVIDKDDRCPNTPRGTAVNIKGCSKTDTDNDGMPDEWEQDNELNPEENDAKKDNDNDGLTNKEEYEANTLPKDKNTDNGKATDGEEIDENTDPLDPSDDLVRTPKTTLILSIAGILLLLALSALLAHYLSHKKRKYEPPHLPEYEPLKKETIQTLKEVAKSETLLEKIQKLKAKEGSIERLRSHAKTGIEKLQEIKPAGIERLKPKKGSIEQLRKETLKKKTK